MKRFFVYAMFASAGVCAVFRSGLAGTFAYWDFSSDALGETDIAGGNDLFNGGVTISDGATVFAGDEAKALCTRQAVDVMEGAAYTIECFIQADRDCNGMIMELSQNYNNALGGLMLHLPEGVSVRGREAGRYNGEAFDDARGLCGDGRWHHVAVIIDPQEATPRDTVKLYLDGIRQTNHLYGSVGSFLGGGHHLYIGSRGGASHPFKGRIDDVRITEGALSTNQFMKARSTRVGDVARTCDKAPADSPCASKKLPDSEIADTWGGRKSHPAVVNPVCRNDPRAVLDLGGEWTFAAFAALADRSQFFNMRQYKDTWPGEHKITVPGTWESQGVGKSVPSAPRCCYGGNASHFPLKHGFSGHGWSRRTFTIPADWRGKRIWLKVGGVGCQGWFWVNDTPVAHVFDYCASRKFEITDLVEPGREAKFVVEVSNAAPSKLGTAEAVACFGGILRPLELEATPQTFIDDAWVRGDFDAKTAEVHVTVGGAGLVPFADATKSAPSVIRVTIDGLTASRTIPQPTTSNSQLSAHNFQLAVPLSAFRPWSPEHPNLYTARVDLVENGIVVQTRHERFGVRKFEVRGKDFYLNGQPFFMRGCGFHEIDPIYGRHRPRRDDCRAKIAKARAAGFNFARLHTRCESPEFFDAADELGLMLQPELPYYGDFSTGMARFDPIADAKELWENFRGHPSFAVYCGGNEGTFGPVMGRRFYSFVKAMDPDRLVIEQDTRRQPPWKRDPARPDKGLANYIVEGTDDFIAYPDRIWPRGEFNPPCPMIAHEYLNLSVKADSRLDKDYTGMWDHPVKRSVRGAWLARFGLDHGMGDKLQDAQHHLQSVWQKLGIESARKDPCCDGYYFWSLTDAIMANEPNWNGVEEHNFSYLAQGLLTPFLTEKAGGQTLAGFAEFNSPVGVFIDAKPEYLHLVSGEKFAFDVLFANYGDVAVRDAVVRWSIRTVNGGTELSSGSGKVGDLALGGVRKVAVFEPFAPPVGRALAAELAVEVVSGAGTAAHGRWACWLFPSRAKRDGRDIAAFGACRAAVASAFDGVLPPERAEAAKVVIADAGSPEAIAARARGQSVVEIGGLDGPLNVKLDWWFHKNIVGATFDTGSPILKYLPESKSLSTLHFRIFKKGLPMPAKDFPPEAIAVVSEEQSSCCAHLGERTEENGARHIFVHGLAIDQSLPESVAILDGIVDRARERIAGSAGAGIYDAELYSQVRLENLTDANRATFIADAKNAGVDVVWLSISDLFIEGAQRQSMLRKLAAEIPNFETAGFTVGVWITGFGWGGIEERPFFKGCVKITNLEGKPNCGAVCPLDPKLRRALADNVRDVAHAGARFILMDDDYVQSARGLVGCSCPRHLALVASKCGRQLVTCEDVKAAFTGKPNALRTAYLDVGGEVAIGLARELRRAVDEVDASVGMGLCASYTHWDVEGCDLPELVGAFAGKGRRFLRITGAPWWKDARGLPGTGLADILESVRLQSAWTRGLEMTVIDENDPYPRKIAQVPAWRCELYDKAVIADGRLGRHKYMLCYGADRAEPGYLEAHLADMPDDPKLRRVFAGTTPYGVKVNCSQHRLRTAELPVPFIGEARVAALYSMPVEAFVLRRKGIPTRFDGPDESDEPLAVTVSAPTPDVYQVVHCDREKGEYAVLLENTGDKSADVKIVTKGAPRVLAGLRGKFVAVSDGISLAGLPPHSYAAVRFALSDVTFGFPHEGEADATAALQAVVDRVSASGGGTVRVSAGRYVMAGLCLKDNVTLHLEKDAVLLGATNHLDYSGRPLAVVSAVGVTNAALVGRGKIDGRGWALPARDHAPNRWYACLFRNCRDVRVEGVRLESPAFWTCYFKECDGVVVRGVDIHSHVNFNNDGIDIGSRNVLVEDCTIDSDDDALCLKSENPDFVCENIEVRNCRISSNCNFMKFGTVTCGGFRNCRIHHCTLIASKTSRLRRWRGLPGVTDECTGLAGIALEMVDGGTMENVRVHDITMLDGVQTPILVRLARRGAPRAGKTSFMRDVLIENVTSKSTASIIASSITGVPGLRPQGITLRNLDLTVKGGGRAADAVAKVPEVENCYPENRMFGLPLPAYGFYVRQADNVRFEDVRLCYTGDTEERSAVVHDDCTGVTFDNCSFQPPSKAR